MARPKKPKNTTFSTYGEFLCFSEEARWELIDGVAYSMVSNPGKVHQEILLALAAKFYNFLDRKTSKVFVPPFVVRLPKEKEETGEKISTVVQPDITIVCDLQKLDDEGILGTPDLIIEIISPATATQDHIRKLALYEHHKVREYWIVHPLDKIVMIYKLQENGNYGKSENYSATDRVKVGIFDHMHIDFQDIF